MALSEESCVAQIYNLSKYVPIFHGEVRTYFKSLIYKVETSICNVVTVRRTNGVYDGRYQLCQLNTALIVYTQNL